MALLIHADGTTSPLLPKNHTKFDYTELTLLLGGGFVVVKINTIRSLAVNLLLEDRPVNRRAFALLVKHCPSVKWTNVYGDALICSDKQLPICVRVPCR